MDSGYTTVEHWLDPERPWSHCAVPLFPEVQPPLPELGYWQGGRLWPSDRLIRITTLWSSDAPE